MLLADISNHSFLVTAAENKFPSHYWLLLKTGREVLVAGGEIGR